MTLLEIFEKQEKSLYEELQGLRVPDDSKKIEKIISQNLEKIFDDNGEFRQNLTQSEDYILQAAISLLNAQQEMSMKLVGATSTNNHTQDSPTRSLRESGSTESTNKPSIGNTKVNAGQALVGSAGGALIGNIVLGGWGAVFGAIAGTAVVLYVASTQSNKTETEKPIKDITQPQKSTTASQPLDIEKFIGIVERICESVDNLIETFRAQIKRVVDKYENMDKPTIERDFRVLLEGIQSLIGYKRGHSADEEKYLSKLQTRVEDLAELLDNYDLVAVDYTPEHADWFEAVESNNATQIKLVNPAIVKGNTLVLKGKIFTPKV